MAFIRDGDCWHTNWRNWSRNSFVKLKNIKRRKSFEIFYSSNKLDNSPSEIICIISNGIPEEPGFFVLGVYMKSRVIVFIDGIKENFIDL
jgi:hypothetical protein